MKNLNFECKRSAFIISPANYKELKSDNPKLQWFVMCRFYELEQKTFVFKKKVIKSLSLKEKKLSIPIIIAEMELFLDKRDYNPRTKSFMFEKSGLHKDLYFVEALNLALELKDVSNDYRKDVKYNLAKIAETAPKINLDHLKIKEIELLHIKRLLEALNLTSNSYNKYKIHLSSLFAELVNESCLKVNPCTGLKSKKHQKAIKKIFTDDEIKAVYDHILTHHPYFSNYFQIFLMSGCRNAELLRLKKKDVSLDKREFTIDLQKGGMNKLERRAILNKAFPFWENQISKCKSENDYLFSDWFSPGEKKKQKSSLYQWWRLRIMKKLNLDITIYSLKHYFLDKLDEANHNAQLTAGHHNREITAIYTVGKKNRELEYLKEIEFENPCLN